MKHERGIMPAPKQSWRLKKTLARRLEFRPVEVEDVRFAWAAYKQGALADMGKPFSDTTLTAQEFDTAFQAVVTTRYHGGWTLFAETRKGYLPAGMVFAFYSHADPALSPFMIVGDIVWFPWATPRNRVESAVNFFAVIRATIPMMDYSCRERDKRLFETICKHGVMQRVGTTFNVVRGEPCAIFETRAV